MALCDSEKRETGMKLDLDERLMKVLLRNVRMDVTAADIAAESDLINDLALDSILIVNLFADLEEEFNIEINVQEIQTPILSKYRLLKEYVLEKTIL
jgi:acyl carrier protein